MKHLAAASLAFLAASCAVTHTDFSSVGDAKAAESGMLCLRSLAGTWVGMTENAGQKTTMESHWRVTAGGSAIEETLFAGTPHEMVSMFHRDGSNLVMTHYCAAGNQPRMRCTSSAAAAAAGKLEFTMTDVSNLASPDALHMAKATFEVLPNGDLRETWTAMSNGKPDHVAEFTFSRKR